jgi:hypothetical protein
MALSENEEVRQMADQVTRPGAALVAEAARAKPGEPAVRMPVPVTVPEPVNDEDVRREPGCSY